MLHTGLSAGELVVRVVVGIAAAAGVAWFLIWFGWKCVQRVMWRVRRVGVHRARTWKRIRNPHQMLWNGFVALCNSSWGPAVNLAVIVVISLAMPWCFAEFRDLLVHDFPQYGPPDKSAIILVCLVSSLAATAFITVTRAARVVMSERLITKLLGDVTPPGGHTADLIWFRPIIHNRIADGPVMHYHDLDKGLPESDEWVVLLQQISKPATQGYTTKNLEEQIDQLEQRLEEVKKSRHGVVPVLNWVCFVSNSGRFHARQSYNTFEFEIRKRRNGSYDALLNCADEIKFWEILKSHITATSPKKGEASPGIELNTIPGLETFWIAKGIDTETAIKTMIKLGQKRAMLVSSNQHGRPLGEITVDGLFDSAISEPLKKSGLESKQNPEGRYGDTPPGLSLTSPKLP